MKTLGITEKILFEVDKNTRIVFNINTKGIGEGIPKYIFTLSIKDIEYSFDMLKQEGELIVEVPALNNILKPGVVGTHVAKIEVIIDNNIYLKPWEESIEIYSNPKIDATLEVVPSGQKVYLKEGPKGDKGEPGKDISKDEITAIIKSVIDDEIQYATGADKKKFKKIKLRILEDLQDRI